MTSKLRLAAIVLALGAALMSFTQSQKTMGGTPLCDQNLPPNPDECPPQGEVECCYITQGGNTIMFYERDPK